MTGNRDERRGVSFFLAPLVPTGTADSQSSLPCSDDISHCDTYVCARHNNTRWTPAWTPGAGHAGILYQVGVGCSDTAHVCKNTSQRERAHTAAHSSPGACVAAAGVATWLIPSDARRPLRHLPSCTHLPLSPCPSRATPCAAVDLSRLPCSPQTHRRETAAVSTEVHVEHLPPRLNRAADAALGGVGERVAVQVQQAQLREAPDAAMGGG